MNKKFFFTAVSVVIVLMVAAIATTFFGHAPNPLANNSITTSTQATTTTANQIPTSTLPSQPPQASSTSSPYQAKFPLENSFAINTPNTLILVDPQGRRTGRDPATGIMYHEIPGTTYFEEGRSGQLYFYSPPTGQYTINIIGGQTGQYHLDSWVSDGQHPPPAQRISGEIQKGSVIVYAQNYDTANLASSTFSLQDTASSTASITSAPPNNLPPPPVP